jgi:tetratricopeptide (TPR) repeat protein
VRRFRGGEIEPRTIARELNVDAVLLGSFQQEGDRILATLTLMEAESGLVVWAEELEEPYGDLFQVQRRIARGAASSLKRSLSGAEEEILAAPESRSVEAYDLYLQGAYLMQAGDRESTEIAFQYFSRAAELDPNLVGAHLGLGAVYNVRYWSGWGSGAESLQQSAVSYGKALALDPASMVARQGLLMRDFYMGRYDVVLDHGKRAAEAGRPDDPETLFTRALAYHYGGLPTVSLELYQRAIDIDPGYPEAHYFLVSALLWSGAVERAIQAGTDYIDRFGDDSDIHTHLGLAYRLLGDEDNARKHFSTAARGDEHPWVYLASGHFFSERGERERAVELWKKGAATAESNLAVDPDHVSMRAYRAAFRALLSGDHTFIREAEQAYEAAGYWGQEFEALMVARLRIGGSDGAIERLHEKIKEGRTLTYWETFVPPSTNSLQRLRAENEILKTRYRERYGTSR